LELIFFIYPPIRDQTFNQGQSYEFERGSFGYQKILFLFE